MLQLWKLFGQRHPAHDEPKGYLRTITVIGVLVFLILWVFTPFNFQRFPESRRFLMALVYSGTAYLTMLVCLAWIVLFPQVFKASTWTLGKELLLIIYQFATISFSVWLLTQCLEGGSRSYVYTWSMVAAGGILPYLVATSLNHIYLLKRNLREASAVQERIPEQASAEAAHLLAIPGLLVPLSVGECLFVRSGGNYLHIVAERMDTIQTYIVRETLRRFMNDNPFPELFQCHRTCVVNLTHISRVSGNAAGCFLKFREELPEIPVSRANVLKIKQLLVAMSPSG